LVAKAFAAISPMPVPPPVTTATAPSRLKRSCALNEDIVFYREQRERGKGGGRNGRKEFLLVEWS
jgi:hypothetical protein